MQTAVGSGMRAVRRGSERNGRKVGGAGKQVVGGAGMMVGVPESRGSEGSGRKGAIVEMQAAVVSGMMAGRRVVVGR